MKKILCFLFLMVGFCACERSEHLEIDDIVLEPYIIENFSQDAKQLYYQEILDDTTHFNYDEPVLDEDEITKILKIIQAVYNLNSLYRDTVFMEYSIHRWNCNSLNSILIAVQPDAREIKNLVDERIPTGNAQLDHILTIYGIDSVEAANQMYPEFPWLTLYTLRELNMIPMKKELDKIPSILLVELQNGCAGDGNNITLNRNRRTATITFSIGRGDCPSGCIYHRYWEFRVEDGKAEFVKSYEKGSGLINLILAL